MRGQAPEQHGEKHDRPPHTTAAHLELLHVLLDLGLEAGFVVVVIFFVVVFVVIVVVIIVVVVVVNARLACGLDNVA